MKDRTRHRPPPPHVAGAARPARQAESPLPAPVAQPKRRHAPPPLPAAKTSVAFVAQRRVVQRAAPTEGTASTSSTASNASVAQSPAPSPSPSVASAPAVPGASASLSQVLAYVVTNKVAPAGIKAAKPGEDGPAYVPVYWQVGASWYGFNVHVKADGTVFAGSAWKVGAVGSGTSSADLSGVDFPALIDVILASPKGKTFSTQVAVARGYEQKKKSADLDRWSALGARRGVGSPASKDDSKAPVKK